MKKRRTLVSVSQGMVDVYAIPEGAASEGEGATEADAVPEGAASEGEGATEADAVPEGAASEGEGAPEADAVPERLRVYTDASICRALGVRRRVLDRLRGEGVCGLDWGFSDGGEIGMSEAWCVRNGLKSIELAGGGGMTFRSVRPAPNPSVVMALRLLDEVLFPVHVGDASRFRAGMLFEAVEQDGRMVLSSSNAWRMW